MDTCSIASVVYFHHSCLFTREKGRKYITSTIISYLISDLHKFSRYICNITELNSSLPSSSAVAEIIVVVSWIVVSL